MQLIDHWFQENRSIKSFGLILCDLLGLRKERLLTDPSIDFWLIFLHSDLTQVDLSIQYTDQHDSFSFVSEAGKAKEKAETSSAAFLVSETNEKLPCSSVRCLEKATRAISS